MNWITVRNRSAYVRLIGVLFLVFAASGLTAPLLSNYIRDLGADLSHTTLVLTAYQLASLASQYWWGRRSDKLGRRKPLVMIGTAGVALAFLGTATAQRYEVLYLTRVVEGVAFAAYSTGSLALIGDLLEDQVQRGRMMGFYRMFGSLAFATMALAGGWVADHYGLRVPIVLSTGCFILACLLVSTIPEKGDAAPAAAPSAPGPDAPAAPPEEEPKADWRVLGPFLALAFAWFAGMGSVVSLWPVFMKAQGYTQGNISSLWGLAAAGEVVWLFVAGLLADRIGKKWVIITGVSGMACIYVAYTVAPALIFFVLIQVVRSFTYSSFETPALLYTTELGLRKQRGRLAGLYYSTSGVGGVVGSALGGAAAQYYGMPTMFRGAAAIMLLVAIVAAAVMPGRTQPELARQREAQPAKASV